MTKKIGLLFLSLFAIFGFGVIFADIIPDNSHYLNRCAKFKNDGIDGYKPIYVQSGVERRDCGCSPFYGSYNCCRDDLGLPGEPYRHAHYVNIGKCLPSEDLTIYLLSESVDLQGITQHNINEKAIFIGDLSVKPSGYVDNSNPFTSETLIYKIVKDGNNYKLKKSDIVKFKMPEGGEEGDFADNIIIEESGNYLLEPDDEEQDIENTEIDEDIGNENNYKLELVESEQGIDVTSGKRITKFAIARILTILIETIILFAIAKLFRKNDQISNWKLLLFGILASTITLPLLRFVLPLFIMDGTWYTVIGELLVTLIEVFIIKYGLKISRGKAILASIICNLCSYLIGLIVF